MRPEATVTGRHISVHGLFGAVTAARESVHLYQFEAAACANDLIGHDCSRESEHATHMTIANSVARRDISTNFTCADTVLETAVTQGGSTFVAQGMHHGPCDRVEQSPSAAEVPWGSTITW